MNKLLRATFRRGKYYAWRCCRSTLSKKIQAGPVAILYCFADTKRYPNSRSFIEEYQRCLGERQTTLVCIDNFSESKEPRESRRGIWDIGGDNSHWEFSGWRKGLEFVSKFPERPTSIVFTNDACLNYAAGGYDGLFFRMRFDQSTLEMSQDSMIGVIDRVTKNHTLLGKDVSSWVRSNFFTMPMDVAAQLPWIFVPDQIMDRILPPEYRGVVLNPTSDTNENLREFLTDWVTRKWRSAAEPSPETWPMLRKKLAAILNERMLTASVRAVGCKVIEVSQLKCLSLCTG